MTRDASLPLSAFHQGGRAGISPPSFSFHHLHPLEVITPLSLGEGLGVKLFLLYFYPRLFQFFFDLCLTGILVDIGDGERVGGFVDPSVVHSIDEKSGFSEV